MTDPHEIDPASSPVSGTSFPKIVENSLLSRLRATIVAQWCRTQAALIVP